MRAGRESRNLSKCFETRRKATRGACYRWHHVVDNASVFVFMYIGIGKDAARKVNDHMAHMAGSHAKFFVCGLPPASLGCLSPLPSSCVRPYTQYHHRHTHPYRSVASPSSLCRRLCQCLVS